MPRKMSAEREREFEELRAYLEFFATRVWGIDIASPAHPPILSIRSLKSTTGLESLSGFAGT